MQQQPFDPSDIQAGRKSALQYIARRDYCSSELRAKLRQHGYDPDTAATVVSALEQDRIIDEEKYIENFIHAQASRGQGPSKISSKLRSLGLRHELVGRLIEETQDWVAHARTVRKKKFGSTLPWVHGDKVRQMRFLQYRGFTSAQIRQALDENADIKIVI